MSPINESTQEVTTTHERHSFNQIENEDSSIDTLEIKESYNDVHIIKVTFKEHGLITSNIDNLLKTLPYTFFMLKPIVNILKDDNTSKSNKIQLITNQIYLNLTLRFKSKLELMKDDSTPKTIVLNFIKDTAEAVALQQVDVTSHHTLLYYVHTLNSSISANHPSFDTFDQSNENVTIINDFALNAYLTNRRIISILNYSKKYILHHKLSFNTREFIKLFKDIGSMHGAVIPTHNWLFQYIHQIPEMFNRHNDIHDCTVFEFKHSESCKQFNPKRSISLTSYDKTTNDSNLKTLFRWEYISYDPQSDPIDRPSLPHICSTYQYLKVYISKQTISYFNDHSLPLPTGKARGFNTRRLSQGCTVSYLSIDRSMERHIKDNPPPLNHHSETYEWDLLLKEVHKLMNKYSRALSQDRIDQYNEVYAKLQEVIFTET
jgi:hypothetical protein